MLRRFLCIALSVPMICILAAAQPDRQARAAVAPDRQARAAVAPPAAPADGTFVPGEVIVMFAPGAVKDTDLSLSAAQDLDNVADDFGGAMEATGDAKEAALDAKSEAAILRDILGDDFVTRDSIAFDDDLSVALVSSGSLDTASMIEKLSADERIASAEANCYRAPQSYDYTYSLDDPLNRYNYQANSPLAHNEAGPDTSARGSGAEVPLSTNAGSLRLTEEEKEREVVVAVVDSGILAEHEDLRNMLWENPGDIGLEGDHGYNFYNNNTDLAPALYHGTHVSGIIAAEAGNGVGIAGTGTASGANVKIMMLSTGSAGDQYEVTNTYKEIGAYNYILKAKKRGVNIVAVNNSWTSPQPVSTIYDEIFDRLGEEGIVSFCAAGNYWTDLDNNGTEVPASGDSPYKVVVGAAGVSGEPAAFTNHGKSKVDVFAPGLNVLSAVSYSCYFPNIYGPEKRNETTEYYGLFDGGMKITTDSDGKSHAIPSKGDTDDSVKSFGASVFHAQVSPYTPDDDSADPDVDKATYELSFGTDRVFTDSEKPGSLELTIHDPQPDVDYFFYFPYEKNPLTTDSNTMFSIYAMNSLTEGSSGYTLSGGEVVVDEDGNCSLYGGGYGPQDPISSHNYNADTHICITERDEMSPLIIGADELKASGGSVGIGISLTASPEKDPGDIHIYLDSIAVSRPDSEIPERSAVTPETSYDVDSGTSMASPACAGAYAVYAACHPIREGQSWADYALTNRAGFLSCVTRTDALKDLCSTGGYIDLTHMGEEAPVITDAVCDLSQKTLTIYGERLSDGYTLKFKRITDESGTETALPSDDMDVRFAGDGKSVVIGNAVELFGSYIEFLLYDSGDVRASRSFFTVKGQKPLEEVYREASSAGSGSRLTVPAGSKLVTDTEGRTLYAFDPQTGKVCEFDGKQFNVIPGTSLKEAALSYMTKERGFDEYDSAHNMDVALNNIQNALQIENRLYHFVDVTCSQGSETLENGEENFHFLASLDLAADRPAWSFEETAAFDEVFEDELSDPQFATANGQICCISPVASEIGAEPHTSSVYCYDPLSGEWSRKTEMPANLQSPVITSKDGELYVMLGGGYTSDSDRIHLSRSVYSFDGTDWTKHDDIPFIGKYSLDSSSPDSASAEAVCAPVKNGFLFFNCAADGAGNTFLYRPDTGSCEPLYYTINDFKADLVTEASAVETRDGVYYLCSYGSFNDNLSVMYCLPKSSGDYESSYEDETGPQPGPAVAPAINLSSARLKAGDTLVLKVTGGTVKKWTSSDPGTASVSSSDPGNAAGSKGIVKALKKGNAVISAVLDTGETLKCTIRTATSPELDQKTVTLKKGQSRLVGIIGRAPGTDNEYKNTKIAEVTSKKDVSTINVKGLAKGETTLKIRVNGVWLELEVIVE